MQNAHLRMGRLEFTTSPGRNSTGIHIKLPMDRAIVEPAGDREASARCHMFSVVWGVLKVSAVAFGRFFPRENKALTHDFVVDPRFRVRAGDLLITRANTSALVGASCVVPQGTYHLMLSDKTLRLELATGRVDANYLCIALSTARVRQQISERASGTSGSMKNISQQSLLEIRIPLPPKDIQLKISGAMKSASLANEGGQAQLDTLRRLKYGLLQALLSRKLEVKGR